REAARVMRSQIAQHGTPKKKADAPTLADAIPMYEKARRNKDRQASRRGAPLPEDWEYHCGRFKTVFADLLGFKVNTLTRRDFVNAMGKDGKYPLEWVRNERAKWEARSADKRAEQPKEWDDRVLRPMMVCMRPMLEWFCKAGQRWLDREEVADLTPEDYDDDTRYLLPGEVQAALREADKLPRDLGLFIRFLLATCTRSEQALCMEWQECDWGNPFTVLDEEGKEHEALIWIVPRDKKEGRMKGRGKGGKANKLPNRVLLTGDALTVLKRLRAIWEREQADPKNAGYNGVFSKWMKVQWRTARSKYGRRMEDEAGMQPWDRMTLRHTHATYLRYLSNDQSIVTLSMTHTPSTQGAAPVTGKYTGVIARRQLSPNDPLARLAPWHLRLHKLFRDMERGNVLHSQDLSALMADLERSQEANDVMAAYGIERKWLKVEGTKLTVVA
ncbi:MAG TPA: hypothetical protein VFB63_19315, partial [Bryobacteraceae bacterium]|nr:hypothetical protein [Bryobacteraceae bacterium]